MNRIRLITVGGFLGAGKTNLLAEASKRLTARGLRVGVITNDQAPDLVDTQMLARRGLSVQEVAGSCFCCNFNALLGAAGSLRQQQAQVVLAEPVGSCTDLSATILQPLKDRYAAEFELAPLTVLVDPHRAMQTLGSAAAGLHPDAVYILTKQLEEADIIAISKCDLLSADQAQAVRSLIHERFPDREVRLLSSVSGEGIDAWLDQVMAAATAGQRVVDVDYDVYANGEAVLGWLNAAIRLQAATPWAGDTFCGELINRLAASLSQRACAIGHVKILLETTSGDCTANLTDARRPPTAHSRMTAQVLDGRLTVNARVEISPQELESIVLHTLREVAGRNIGVTVEQIHSLRPGRPVPSYRYDAVVK